MHCSEVASNASGFAETSTEKIISKWSAEYLSYHFVPICCCGRLDLDQCFLTTYFMSVPWRGSSLVLLSSHDFYTSSGAFPCGSWKNKAAHLLRIHRVLFARHGWVCIVCFSNSLVSQWRFNYSIGAWITFKRYKHSALSSFSKMCITSSDVNHVNSQRSCILIH